MRSDILRIMDDFENQPELGDEIKKLEEDNITEPPPLQSDEEDNNHDDEPSSDADDPGNSKDTHDPTGNSTLMIIGIISAAVIIIAIISGVFIWFWRKGRQSTDPHQELQEFTKFLIKGCQHGGTTPEAKRSVDSLYDIKQCYEAYTDRIKEYTDSFMDKLLIEQCNNDNEPRVSLSDCVDSKTKELDKKISTLKSDIIKTVKTYPVYHTDNDNKIFKEEIDQNWEDFVTSLNINDRKKELIEKCNLTNISETSQAEQMEL